MWFRHVDRTVRAGPKVSQHPLKPSQLDHGAGRGIGFHLDDAFLLSTSPFPGRGGVLMVFALLLSSGDR